MMGESIQYGESKTTGVQFSRGHVVWSLHTAQHTTLQIMKKITKKILNEMFFTFVLTPLCTYSQSQRNNC